MPVEIERKFLVRHDGWRKPDPGQRYLQGYLCKGEVTIRVRCAGSRGFLTIKGVANGRVRPEFEYEIPVDEAEALLKLCHGRLIDKVRHQVLHAGMMWHVDEFSGDNSGLVLAEIELCHPQQAVVLPDWIGEEVTSDERYRNSHLADVPWAKGWGTQPREDRSWVPERSGSADAPTQPLADTVRTITAFLAKLMARLSGCGSA